MKYVLVTGGFTGSDTNETAQLEIISENGNTVICQNEKNNYPKTLSGASAAVTNGTTIVACGGQDSKFF